MSLPTLYKKYLKPEALSDKELDEFIKGMSKLAKLLQDMGLDASKVEKAVYDGEYMKACRLDKKRKKK